MSGLQEGSKDAELGPPIGVLGSILVDAKGDPPEAKISFARVPRQGFVNRGGRDWCAECRFDGDAYVASPHWPLRKPQHFGDGIEHPPGGSQETVEKRVQAAPPRQPLLARPSEVEARLGVEGSSMLRLVPFRENLKCDVRTLAEALESHFRGVAQDVQSGMCCCWTRTSFARSEAGTTGLMLAIPTALRSMPMSRCPCGRVPSR